jgi:creatinine amidohydrolase
VARSIGQLTSPDVAEAIASAATAVLPFGSIEQHGPHLPCGTDIYAAELIAECVAERLDALLVPFGPYGVTPIHAGHPGTISLRRDVFERLLRNVCEELTRMGVRRLVFVNWHEGNIASLDAVATELQDERGLLIATVQACYVAQRLYEPLGGELTHGGGIETMSVMAYDPSLLALERAGEPARPPGAAELDEMRRSREVYGYVTDVTLMATDGWYGNPGWATSGRAEEFAGTVADEIMKRLEMVLGLQERRHRSMPDQKQDVKEES